MSCTGCAQPRPVVRSTTALATRPFGCKALLARPWRPPGFPGQVQGLTYANMFGLGERFIGAKMLEISRDRSLGDQTAPEALVRLTDEELKHQELFRCIEALAGRRMPAGYRFEVSPNDVAGFVLGKCTWAALAPLAYAVPDRPEMVAALAQ